MKKYYNYIKEDYSEEDPHSDPIIQKIKDYLVKENDSGSWKRFVDHQHMGDCQWVVAQIIAKFPEAKKVFGSVHLDDEYTDDEDETLIEITHHWVTIDGINYDFSKGTLRYYINFASFDLYNPEVIEEWRYHGNFKIDKMYREDL